MRYWSGKDALAAFALGGFVAVMVVVFAAAVVLDGSRTKDNISIPELSRANLLALDGVVPLSRLLTDTGFQTVCLVGPYNHLTFVLPNHHSLPPGFHDRAISVGAQEDEFIILAETNGKILWNNYVRGDLDVLGGMTGTVPPEVVSAEEKQPRCASVQDGAFFVHRHADGVVIGLQT